MRDDAGPRIVSGRLFWAVMAVIGVALILLIVNNDQGMTFGLPNGTFASTLYLGIWGVVVAAVLLRRRLHFGEVTRNIAIWLFIALVLVAGYTYRFDLRSAVDNVRGALVPGEPISAVGQNGALTVTVVKSASGHFEVQGDVNGAPVHFLVDTGATPVVLSTSDAERAGIDPAALHYTVPVMTANGQARAAPVRLDTIRIGKIERHNISAVVAPDDKLPGSLLGMNFLNTLSGFSVERDRLVLKD